MDQVINALYSTMELWIFLAILSAALIVEPFLVD